MRMQHKELKPQQQPLSQQEAIEQIHKLSKQKEPVENNKHEFSAEEAGPELVKIRDTLGPFKYDAAIANEDKQRIYKAS